MECYFSIESCSDSCDGECSQADDIGQFCCDDEDHIGALILSIVYVIAVFIVMVPVLMCMYNNQHCCTKCKHKNAHSHDQSFLNIESRIAAVRDDIVSYKLVET